jgi:squalene-hopene/tetraprenyl-beta-curcumene cyclase
LIRTQNSDGSWTEDETTGTGFPKVFYLKYDMYRNAWPLLALATFRQVHERVRAKAREPIDGKSHQLPEELAAKDRTVRGSTPPDRSVRLSPFQA